MASILNIIKPATWSAYDVLSQKEIGVLDEWDDVVMGPGYIPGEVPETTYAQSKEGIASYVARVQKATALLNIIRDAVKQRKVGTLVSASVPRAGVQLQMITGKRYHIVRAQNLKNYLHKLQVYVSDPANKAFWLLWLVPEERIAPHVSGNTGAGKVKVGPNKGALVGYIADEAGNVYNKVVKPMFTTEFWGNVGMIVLAIGALYVFYKVS